MKYLLLVLGLFIIQFFYFKLADRLNIIDKPNNRSSHTQITLRGGGIIFYIAMLLYFLIDGFNYPWFFAGLTLIAAISFADDVKPQSPKIRLIIHFIAMLLMFYQWNLYTLPWYYTFISLVLCTGILNAYNFMDGINGLTGVYSLAAAITLWYINDYRILFVDNSLLYYIIASLIVFSFFNLRRRAKCFAGDVGAISIAFIIVFLIGYLIIKTGDFSYIMLLAVYGVDTVLTIIHRIMLRENIFDAHRKHCYQLMANELKVPHVYVSLIYMVLQIIINLGLLASDNYKGAYSVIVIILLSVIYIIFMKKYFHLHCNTKK